VNILILTNHLNFGGITAYVQNLSKALNGRDGIEITVASRGGALEKDLEAAGISCLRIPLTTKCEVSLKVFWSFLVLRKKIKSLKIDLIHANTRVTQVLAALLSCATGVPALSTCHGYFKRRLSRRMFACWGERVIAISDQVQEHLIRDFGVDPKKIKLIYNGVDLEKFSAFSQKDRTAEMRQWGLNPDKKIIGHIGRLSSVKGQKFLILAAAVLAQKRSDLEFLIIGDGDEKENLEKLIRQKHLEDVVHIRPSVLKTAPALSLMDVFVMPSLQEGLGISLLEAQAQGVPVVASRVGGIPAIIEDAVTGLLVPAGDEGALASAITRFLEDNALREALIQKAKRQVREKFSLSTMANKTRDVYKELCAC
jgi:glycosyltransferase involved in cell wall biosynthesis